MRLIDADALKNKLQEHRDFFVRGWGGFEKMSFSTKCRVDEIDNCIAEIVNSPTIEAAPVVHGQWIECTDDKFVSYDGAGRPRYRKVRKYQCSNCRRYAAIKSSYCLNCGAKMDGDSHG